MRNITHAISSTIQINSALVISNDVNCTRKSAFLYTLYLWVQINGKITAFLQLVTDFYYLNHYETLDFLRRRILDLNFDY